jgi:chromosome segregation protein
MTQERQIHEALTLIEHKKTDLEKTLANLPQQGTVEDSYSAQIIQTKATLGSFREKRRALEGRIGRLEGMIEVERRLLTERSQAIVDAPAISFAPTEYTQLLADIEYFIVSIKDATTLEVVRKAIEHIDPILASLKAREPHHTPEVAVVTHEHSSGLKETALELETLGRELKVLVAQESEIETTLHRLETAREENQRTLQSATTTRYEVQGALTNCNAELSILSVNKNSFIERKAYFDTELQEAGFLFGPQFLRSLQENQAVPELNLHDLKRTIDRLKIRLDEHAGIGNEVVSEYESTVERDAFLAREISDIEGSIRNLESLIIDLKKVLDDKFTSGVTIINERFGEFFKTMFGGGSAFLEVTIEKKRKSKASSEDFEAELLEGEEDNRFLERGIDVHVNLPEKKVKELNMLSGGERSLVSIALLFAISQVNPPPFLVLDETDAALDEANSRRYGDMVERLSEYSQLIVVTHNRETMSRASVLYGVTLGIDGASKLLSIKFDEAVKVAK